MGLGRVFRKQQFHPGALLKRVEYCQIPLVPSIIYLSVPHFGIGAGIGTVDAALVPLLATLADKQATYGGTFALGQTAVGLAYCLGKSRFVH